MCDTSLSDLVECMPACVCVCVFGAQVLVALLTTLMYGLGLPILFLYAFVGFTIRYWLDKSLLLRYSKKPPRYGPQLASMALAILPWALLLHLGLSVWMVSSPGLLPSGVLPSSTYHCIVGRVFLRRIISSRMLCTMCWHCLIVMIVCCHVRSKLDTIL